MKKKNKRAAVEDMDTFVFDWTTICQLTLQIHEKNGFPPPIPGQKVELPDILHDLENAGIVDSLFAEKMEHIIRYRYKFSFTEPMDHYELMDMLDLTRDFIHDHLINNAALVDNQ